MAYTVRVKILVCYPIVMFIYISNVFVCGGWSGQLPVCSVDVYSINQDTWHRVAPLPTPTMIRAVAVNFPRKSMLNLSDDDDDVTGRKLRRESSILDSSVLDSSVSSI